MTQEEFDEFVTVDIPCALFHVESTDKDDASGSRLDEVILIRMLNQNPQALQHKRLQWFVHHFIESHDEFLANGKT
jgi:hypothetical protein